MTSILSDENQFIELKLKKGLDVISHLDYIVIPEPKITEFDLNMYNMRIKQTRVSCALNKIKSNLVLNNIELNTRFFDYFVINDENEGNESSNKTRPKYCSNKKTAKKNPCSECNEICSLPMEMILHPSNPVSQADIFEELMVHHHPSSRIIKENGKQRARTTKEAAEELASHYVFVHNKKKPSF